MLSRLVLSSCRSTTSLPVFRKLMSASSPLARSLWSRWRCCDVAVSYNTATTHCNNTPQHTTTRCNTLQQNCKRLQHTATKLWHTATHYNTLKRTTRLCNALQRTATHCKTLQHTATHCNALQCTATHCNTLQQHKFLSLGSQSESDSEKFPLCLCQKSHICLELFCKRALFM